MPVISYRKRDTLVVPTVPISSTEFGRVSLYAVLRLCYSPAVKRADVIHVSQCCVSCSDFDCCSCRHYITLAGLCIQIRGPLPPSCTRRRRWAKDERFPHPLGTIISGMLTLGPDHSDILRAASKEDVVLLSRRKNLHSAVNCKA